VGVLGLEILRLTILGSAQHLQQAVSNSVQERTPELLHESARQNAKAPWAPSSVVRRESHLAPAQPHHAGLLQEDNHGAIAYVDTDDDHRHGHGKISGGQGIRYQDNKENRYAEFTDTSGRVRVTTKTKTQTTTTISCGGHVASSCEECVKTKPDGSLTTDHGEEWCHGDCVYSAGVCHVASASSQAAFSKMLKAEEGGNPPVHLTTQVPDLQNPNMTEWDNNTINAAAEAALKEETILDAEKDSETKGRRFPWKKFWLVIVVIFSVILGICCICSIVAVVTFNQVTAEEKKVEEVADEAEAEEEDDAEGEDDEGAEEAEEDEEA